MFDRKLPWLTVAAAVAALLTSEIAGAHHSGAVWNLSKRTSVQGQVRSVEFRNPHGKMKLLVTKAGAKPVEWHVETSAINLLMRRGWKPGRIKVGDVVTVTGHLKKVPGTELYLREVRLPDGTVFGDPSGNDKQLD